MPNLNLQQVPPPAGRRIRRSVVLVGMLLILGVLASVLWPSFERRSVKATTPQPSVGLSRTVKESTALKDLMRHQEAPVPPVPVAVSQVDDCNAECQQLRQENAALREAMKKIPPTPPPPKPPQAPVSHTTTQALDADKKAAEARRKMVVWKAPHDRADAQTVKVKSPTTPYSLSPGWLIPIVTEGQVSNDTPGSFLVRVREDVRDSATGRYVVIPQESIIVLAPQGQTIYGDNRLAAQVKTLTFPDGRYVALTSSTVTDVQGQPGFADQIDRRYGPILVSVLLQGVLKMGSGIMLGGVASDPLERMGGSVLSEASSQGQRQVRQTIRTDPILTIRPGYKGTILLDEELALDRPWPGAGR